MHHLYDKMKRLWTREFIYWWIVSLATVFMFDLFWMGQTTFRPMSYFAFYPVLFLQAFILSFPSLFAKRGVLQTLWLLFFDALFIANLMYCRTYYNAIPLQSYGLVGNLVDFKSSVADSFKWYFSFLPLLSIGALIWYYIYVCKKWKRPSFLQYAMWVLLLTFVVWAGDAWRGGIMKRMDFMANYAYLSSSITPIYSLGGYLMHDYFKVSEKISPEERQYVNEWLENHYKENDKYWTDTIRENRKIPKNLVLILCESLESWVIGTKIEGKEITPNLNKLISDSTTFYAPNVVTQVGSGRSIDAQLLILTGMLPMNNQAYAYKAVENKFYSLPDAIKKHGGRTTLFTCDKPYVWNQALVAEAFGIDSVIFSKDFHIDETAGPSRRLSDGSFMRQIREKLIKGDIWPEGSRAMIMAVTYSGHNPFVLPQHLRKLKIEGDYPEIIKNYIITANYTDASLMELIEYLKTREDWEETMVIITGDHEGLASERKTALSNPETAKFVDKGMHTPLIILNSPVTGKYDGNLGEVDLYSTILDLMSFRDYEWRGLGNTILNPNFHGVAIDSNGNIEGDTISLSKKDILMLKDSRNISDLILKFNLLEGYIQNEDI